MKDRVRSNILKVKNYVPGKPIEEVQRELGLKEVVKLASNENCFGPSPKAVSAIRRSLTNLNRYPDSSSFYLRRALAKFLKVGEDNLVLGNGSDEVICLAVRAFVGDGDEVIIAKPSFLIYEIVSQVQNAKIISVPLKEDLKHDLDAMASAVTARTKLIFIANPDNPTGTYVNRDELERFLEKVPQGVIIFLDEAYFEFAASAGRDYPNGIDYLSRPGVIVARSFSKAYGLAGIRIGYGISDPSVTQYLERVREPFNVNLLAQAAALAALEDRTFLRKTLLHAKREKGLLYKTFDKMGLSYIKSATNFILVDIKKDSKLVFEALLKEGVIVRDMKAWGWDTFIRVTVGTRQENLKFIRSLRKII